MIYQTSKLRLYYCDSTDRYSEEWWPSLTISVTIKAWQQTRTDIICRRKPRNFGDLIIAMAWHHIILILSLFNPWKRTSFPIICIVSFQSVYIYKWILNHFYFQKNPGLYSLAVRGSRFWWLKVNMSYFCFHF